MKYVGRFLILLTAATFLAGCNVSGNITDLTLHATSIQLGQLTGLVSGGTVQTVGGYTVYATCGDAVANISQTTSGGYQVYSNVTGNYVSSSVVTTMQ